MTNPHPELTESTSHAVSDEAQTMISARQIADLDDGATQAAVQGSASLFIFAAVK